MPRLVPRSTREVEQLLRHFGYILERRTKEDVWRHRETGRTVIVPRNRASGEVYVGTLKSILEQAGISREEALGFWGIG